jgi:hypothetical protein
MHRKQLLKVYQEANYGSVETTGIPEISDVFNSLSYHLLDTKKMFRDHLKFVPDEFNNGLHYLEWNTETDTLSVMAYAGYRSVYTIQEYALPEGEVV